MRLSQVRLDWRLDNADLCITKSVRKGAYLSACKRSGTLTAAQPKAPLS
ncbi:hypothetical protein [Xanthocytophaga agilis]|uniref:Uncharacterized protein n=1 Tax=Xanthocytophaga agilis TaxID=3048010 RepID=A0AAE3R5V7_9BACT|nr:hypothetical protein [Xanthocytophaga agilis]MDJ1501984.1 hypothetical protein [Xanthocytophaga agilis]